ncbi:MAG: polysaccharide biosynthesis/export family protein [Gammaproteobacteria bacterium]
MNSRIALAFLAVLFWAQPGLGWGPSESDNTQDATDFEQGSTVAPSYRLAAGDRVSISVFGHADLSGQFEINGAGMITMPLISDVKAAGLTVNELEEAIVESLRPDYLINPKVSAEIVDFRPIYIIGEVVNPGSYPYSNGMSVINAVAVAGGFSYRAKKSKMIIRRDDGERTVEINVDLDTAVLPGDVIEVPERFF